MRERELAGALVRHVREFLIELGVGFAFVGVAEYRLTASLPQDLREALPSAEAL